MEFLRITDIQNAIKLRKITDRLSLDKTLSGACTHDQLCCLAGFPHDEIAVNLAGIGTMYMTTRRQNPVLPVLIVALFLMLLVFLLVSRKGETVSHPQPATQNP